VEYSDFKEQANEVIFTLPDNIGKGTAIWEPLNARSGLFTRDYVTTALFRVYEDARDQYLSPGGEGR
jgi:hypothetical protein